MSYSTNDRDRLLNAGGILSIIAGVLEIIGGGIWVVMIMRSVTLGPLLPLLPNPSLPGSGIWIVYVQNRFVNLALIVMVLGVIATVGGISVLRRRSYGLSLAGAICALPSVILGIPAVIFVSRRKIEFGVERKEKGIYGGQRHRLTIAGGALSIVAGITQLVCGAVLITDFFGSHAYCWRVINVLFLPFLPETWRDYLLFDFLWSSNVFGAYVGVLIWWAIVGGCIGAMGTIAIVGGIAAVRKTRFGLSLAGAVCALPSTVLGILAVIFVALGKREFSAARNEDGI